MTVDRVRARSAVAWSAMVTVIGCVIVPFVSEQRVMEPSNIAFDSAIFFAFAYAVRPWSEEFRHRLRALPAAVRARLSR